LRLRRLELCPETPTKNADHEFHLRAIATLALAIKRSNYSAETVRDAKNALQMLTVKDCDAYSTILCSAVFQKESTGDC
jgi:hypothetical protein